MFLCGIGIGVPGVTGLGQVLQTEQQQGSSHIFALKHTFIAWQIFYALSVLFSKLAILFLYLPVFTSAFRPFVYTVCIMGIIVDATSAIDVFTAFLQCTPGTLAANGSLTPGKCFDHITFQRYMAIPNVITGFIMLIMPLPLVWRLKITPIQKIGLSATFLHGAIGFMGSCARLLSLSKTQQSHELDRAVFTIWTINEPANYVIAACLPILRPVLARYLPESFFVLSKPTHSTRGRRTPGQSQGDTNGSTTKRAGSWPWTKLRKPLCIDDVPGSRGSQSTPGSLMAKIKSGIRGLPPSANMSTLGSSEEPLSTIDTFHGSRATLKKVSYDSSVDVEAQKGNGWWYKAPTLKARTMEVSETELTGLPRREATEESWLKI